MHQHNDWNPRSEDALNKALKTYDAMRENCPVAYSDYLQWSVFPHSDVSAIINEHKTFSSQVSRHLPVPNGMDPPMHGIYREMINPYFSAQAVQLFARTCHDIANRYSYKINQGKAIDFMTEFAWPWPGPCNVPFWVGPDHHIAT